MKKCYVAILLLCLPLWATAQLTSGDHLIRFQADGISGGINGHVPLGSDNLLSANIYPRFDLITSAFYLDYRYALTDHLVVGGAFFTSVAIFYERDGQNSLANNLGAALRYYFIRNPYEGAFLELNPRVAIRRGAAFTNGDENTTRFAGSVRVGYQQAAVPGIYITPTLTWSAVEGANPVTLSVGVEALLNRRGVAPEGAVLSSFAPGDYLLGMEMFELSRSSRRVGQRLNRSSRVEVLPTLYRFLSPRTALGVRLGLTYQKVIFERSTRSATERDVDYSFNPEVRLRRYFGTTSGALRLFAEAGVGGRIHHVRQININGGLADDTDTGYDLTGALAAGAQWFVTDQLALELAPTYRYLRSGRGRTGLSSVTLAVGARWWWAR